MPLPHTCLAFEEDGNQRMAGESFYLGKPLEKCGATEWWERNGAGQRGVWRRWCGSM
jgi:hypothetical protein